MLSSFVNSLIYYSIDLTGSVLQMLVLLETEEQVHSRWSVATNQLMSSGIRHVSTSEAFQNATPARPIRLQCHPSCLALRDCTQEA